MESVSEQLSSRQQAFLNALLVSANYAEAARLARIHPATYVRYMKNPVFQAALREARKEQHAEAAGGWASLQQPALAVVRRALNCEDPMVALKAADMVFKHNEGMGQAAGPVPGGSLKITEIVVQLQQLPQQLPVANEGTTPEKQASVIEGELGDTGRGASTVIPVPAAPGESRQSHLNQEPDPAWGSLAIVVEENP
jgi:hypothetical protein